MMPGTIMIWPHAVDTASLEAVEGSTCRGAKGPFRGLAHPLANTNNTARSLTENMTSDQEFLTKAGCVDSRQSGSL
ncbi:hypothetical protein IG631_12982 [Alternaria alternata]|nr:hypothetical protein IG631_12982 [Alternaria alternata]